MLPLAIMEKLVASVPKSFTMPNGDVVPIYVETGASLEEAMQQEALGHDGTVDFNYPLITLTDITDGEAVSSPVSSFLRRDTDAEQARQDTFTADDDVDEYVVAEPPIKVNSVVVTATVGGNSGTVLTEGTDYDVIDTQSEGGFGGLDTIKFLAGGQRPDDATQFTVDYDERVIKDYVGEESATNVQIHMHTQTILAGDPLTRDGNGDPLTTASAELHREDLMRVMVQVIKVWSGATLPGQLTNLAAVRERGPIADFSYLEGEGVLRKGFDLPLDYIVQDVVVTQTLLDVDVDASRAGSESEITLSVEDVSYGPT